MLGLQAFMARKDFCVDVGYLNFLAVLLSQQKKKLSLDVHSVIDRFR